MRRALSGLALAVALAGASACSTGDQVFPTTGTLTLQIQDTTLAGQAAEEQTNQFVKWTVSEATADVAGIGPMSLLRQQPPCEIGQLLSGRADLCGIDSNGVVLDPGFSGTVSIRVVVTELEVVRARRPVTDDDTDNDTVPDEDDNCPYVANPLQENANAAAEGDNPVGDACSINNSALDTDGDDVADALDNCVFIPNPGQADASRGDGFVDRVGDDCEQKVLLTPAGGLVLERVDHPFTIAASSATLLRLDFKTKDSLTCEDEVEFTSCTLDADAVTLTAP